MTDHTKALVAFDAAIAKATTADDAFSALQTLVRDVVGAKLFTVMLVDWDLEVSRRAYTSHPETYPTSGTKPLNYGPWFDIVHGKRECYVANTIEDIAKVLFDHETINALGCHSVVNYPVIVKDKLIGTMNMLDVEGHFTPEKVETIRNVLGTPAKLAVLVATTL
ncbi:GAF domain-containing protein [Devosia sp. MC521]|uniref:GAF domain-containing protein n=1 Tax=Devosia sp. MC521 TaxID=2759954 RepID=UPI0015F7C56C|nr:GAF domain-containing protein [Devosia sp. MC521]MBJ6988124.1 GAF domain-containing protein [Devosia sp. MC521]QMW63410.1 GAF domain-containing protein [Devosia sp. MC521]